MIDYIIKLGILSVLIWGLIAFQIHRINAFRNASEKFRNIVLIGLKDIYPVPVNWPENIDIFLRFKFTVLQAAVKEFRGFLPCYKRKSFDRAWLNYYSSYGDEHSQCYHHYMPFSGTSIENGKETTYSNTKIYKETFKHNVDSLLKFAKKT